MKQARSSSVAGLPVFFGMASKCPACDAKVRDLDELNFHLTYTCPSRSTTSETASSVRKRDSGDLLYTKSEAANADIVVPNRHKRTALASVENPIEIDEDEDDKNVESSKVKSSTRLVFGSTTKVSCPACQATVKAEALNFHLDNGCTSRDRPKLLLNPTEQTTDIRKPPGLVVLENFVTLEEEARLVEFVESQTDWTWKESRRNGKHEMKSWGVRIDYSTPKPRTRLPKPEENERDFPEFLTFIVARFAKYPPLSAWWPNEANANRYLKDEGHYLSAHFDDRSLSGEIICNISLLSDCIMTFAKPNSNTEPFRVRLPRLSASVMSRSARYDYTHAITNDDLLGPKRISINFRQQVAPQQVPRSLAQRKRHEDA